MTETETVTAAATVTENAIVTETETAIEIVTAAESAIVTVTAHRNVKAVHAIAIPVLNPDLMQDRSEMPDAGVTTSNHQIRKALSFRLTKGKGNDKLFFDTSPELWCLGMEEKC